MNNLLVKLAQNGTTNMASGLSAGVASYLFLEGGRYNYQIPYLDYSIPAYLASGILVLGASIGIGFTGDFIFPFVSSNTIISKVEKLSRPVSVGLLTVGGIFLMNGLVLPSLEEAFRTFLLGSGSYLLADYTMSTVFSYGPQQIMSVPQQTNIIPAKSFVSSTLPFDFNSFGGFGGFSY